MPDLTLLTDDERAYWNESQINSTLPIAHFLRGALAEALETIIPLRQRVAELEAERRWIPVSTPPTRDDRYLIRYTRCGQTRTFIGDYVPHEKRWLGLTEDAEVIMWCEIPALPAPPKEADNAE